VKATEQLVASCVEALGETDLGTAIREVLLQFLTDKRFRELQSDDLTAGLHVLYRSSDLTVLDVVWPPLMTLYPHDHRMWAAIGIYGGREENEFFRRNRQSIVPSGGRSLTDGTTLMLGADVIHSVRNPARFSYTGAIHVYGGDFVGTPRSQWDSHTLIEEPYNLDAVRREFERAERSFRRSTEGRAG
jgi:predicted metal-dependent enzyme (double-stranded beta helix superfamily)